jgi:hypothetical protein
LRFTETTRSVRGQHLSCGVDRDRPDDADGIEPGVALEGAIATGTILSDDRR